MNRLTLAVLALLSALQVNAAEGDKPRWMLPEQGFIIEESDARVESVTEDEETGELRIEISLPQLDTSIEEVVVVGRKEEKPGFVMPKIPYEIINDLESKRSGIIIWLGSRQDFSLRINYEDGSQAMLPPRVGGLKP